MSYRTYTFLLHGADRRLIKKIRLGMKTLAEAEKFADIQLKKDKVDFIEYDTENGTIYVQKLSRT